MNKNRLANIGTPSVTKRTVKNLICRLGHDISPQSVQGIIIVCGQILQPKPGKKTAPYGSVLRDWLNNHTKAAVTTATNTMQNTVKNLICL